MDGVGVGVPVSSGRLGRRLFVLSSALSGDEPGAAFGFATEGGVTGIFGAVRGNACVGMFGVRDAAGAAALGGGVATGVVNGALGGADGRCAGASEGRCFTTDSGWVEGVPVAAGVATGGGETLRCGGTGGVVAGDAAGLIVAVGAGTMGGVAGKSMGGEGRTLGGIEAEAFGETEAAVAAGEAEGALAAVGKGEVAAGGAMEGLTFG